MSTQEFSPVQETMAGTAPAVASANTRVSPVWPDSDEGPLDPDAGDEMPSVPIDPEPFGVTPVRLSGRGPRSSKRLVTPAEAAASTRRLTPEQKLLILDRWQRSGLPATDFGGMIGLSKQTLYSWKKRFETLGPGWQSRTLSPTCGGIAIPPYIQLSIARV